MRRCMVTTDDNPFDYFTEFQEWYAFDESQGHHTCSLLDRVIRFSDELSEEEQMLAIEMAVNEIVLHDYEGKYIKVYSVEE